MKIVDKNDYLFIQPNLNLNTFDKLDDNEKEEYLYVVSNYQYYLELYLLSKTNIKIFDDNIKDSNMNFRLVDEEKKDYYQTYCGENLNYYYIRNNLNILSLTKEEKDLFLNYIKDANGNLTKDIEKFIETTILKVIKENWINAKINYGPLSERFIVENGTLIIGMRYDEFYPSNDDNWDELYELQEIFLLQNNALLEKNIEENLKIPCRVIRYNDFSVKKNNEINQGKTI